MLLCFTHCKTLKLTYSTMPDLPPSSLLPHSLLLWLLRFPLDIITFSFNQLWIKGCLLVSRKCTLDLSCCPVGVRSRPVLKHLKGIWHRSTLHYLRGRRAHYHWRQSCFTGNIGSCLQSWRSVTKYQGPRRLGAPSYYQSWQSILDELPVS